MEITAENGEKYNWIIIGTIAFLLLQSFLIMMLVKLYNRQRLTSLRLKAAENKFRELVEEDRILRIRQMCLNSIEDQRDTFQTICYLEEGRIWHRAGNRVGIAHDIVCLVKYYCLPLSP